MRSNENIRASFIQNEKGFKIEFHPTDHDFLIVKNCSEEKGAKLCAKYGASGLPSGKDSKDYAIGNFGCYR